MFETIGGEEEKPKPKGDNKKGGDEEERSRRRVEIWSQGDDIIEKRWILLEHHCLVGNTEGVEEGLESS